MSEKVHVALKARLKEMYLDLDDLEGGIAEAETWMELSPQLKIAQWLVIADQRQCSREATALYHRYATSTSR